MDHMEDNQIIALYHQRNSSRYDKACENWQKDVSTRRNLTRHYADSMDSFLEKSIRQFLSESETGNIAYSPLNVFIALGMLAELTDGTGRQQLLELLDCRRQSMPYG